MSENEDYTDKININKLTIENALAISSLTQVVSRTSADVDKLVKHAEKIDKLVMDNSKLDGRLGSLESQVKNDRKTIDIVYVIMKHPKATALVLATAYIFTIYEVRTAILEHLKPLATFFSFIK